IFDLMEKFAGYGFNKSHSAAYALVSYQTAWLKEHYPAHFMAAVLSADMQNTDKVVTLIEECRLMKLPLVVPDVNIGAYNFTVNSRHEIVYGLGAIKGLGEGPVASIIAARQAGGPFTSLLDFCNRVEAKAINKRALEALIRAGALDSLQEGSKDVARATLMASIAETIKAAEQNSRNQSSGIVDMFGDISVPAPVAPQPGQSRAVRPWSEQERLAAERETLGLYLSGHPVDEFLPELEKITRDRLANLKPERESQLVAGLVVATRTMKNKRGDTIAFVTLDDRSARLEVSVFAREYEQFRELLQKDSIVVIDCNVSVDDYNGDSGEMRGRARYVMSLDEARQRHARSLDLHLQHDFMPPDFNRLLANILGDQQAVQPRLLRNPLPPPRQRGAANAGYDDQFAASPAETQELVGPCPVRVHYQRRDAKGTLLLGPQWAVFPTQDLLQRLLEEFGRGRVVLNYSAQ